MYCRITAVVCVFFVHLTTLLQANVLGMNQIFISFARGKFKGQRPQRTCCRHSICSKEFVYSFSSYLFSSQTTQQGLNKKYDNGHLMNKCRVLPRTGHEGPEEEEQRYSSTLSLTLALDEDGWSTPCLGRFTPGKETRYPLWRLGGPKGRSGRLRKLSPPPGY